MKRESDKITLLVVRDDGGPARQIRLSKPMAVALPAAAVLSLSSLVTSMHYHASRSIQELEAEAAALSVQNIRLEAKAADQEKILRQVHTEAAGLPEETKAIRNRLKSVDALEQELKDLISQQKEGPDGKQSAAGKSGLKSVPVPDKKEPASLGAEAASTDAASPEAGAVSADGAASTAGASSGTGYAPADATLPMAPDASTNGALPKAAAATVPSPVTAPASVDGASTGAEALTTDSAASLALPDPVAPVRENGSAPAASESKSRLIAQADSISPSAITVRIGAFRAIVEHSPALQVGGEYVAAYGNREVLAVRETKDELAQIDGMLEEIVRSLSGTVQAAQQADAERLRLELQRKTRNYLWPTSSRTISSSFGYRTDPFKGSSAFHAGIDIAAQTGDVVFAAQEGEVAAADRSPARGNYIELDHGNGLRTLYMHLSSLDVFTGDKVAKGQRIGRVGSTGRSTGPHLHFQVVKQNQTVNPLSYVQPD